MWGRRTKRARELVQEARPYGRRIREDDKLQEHGRKAVEAGDRARRGLFPERGALATARRLAEDEHLRESAMRVVENVREAQARLQPRRSHGTRNRILLVAGVLGAALANPWTGEAARRRLSALLGRSSETSPSSWSPQGSGTGATSTIEETIEVAVPVSTAYNQWTQFEEFPRFMEGVESVSQIDDTNLRWVAQIAGKRNEWQATITEQKADERIVWRSSDGKENSGSVEFERLGDERTRVKVRMSYEADGLVETLGGAVGADRRRVQGDLGRFKKLLEDRGEESGAWRGEVTGGQVEA